MATTYRKSGEIVTVTAPSGGLTVDVPALIGSLFGIPQFTAVEAAECELMIQGEHVLPKTSAQAWTEGQKIFWNAGTSKCDSDSAAGQLIGVAVAVAANPSSTGIVRLNGSVPSTAEGAQTAIPSLTDNSGGATADDTIAVVTAPTLTDWNGSSVYPSAAQATAITAAITSLTNAVKELSTKQNSTLAALRAAGIIAT